MLWDSYFAASLAASAATTMSPVVTWVSPPTGLSAAQTDPASQVRTAHCRRRYFVFLLT
ncbi:hypothetical protein [Colibacter massiliensis]|uniref:hypothetical protein n=1 Tax=Colibacter massiliensis TaxID=1852379 RepID=UPI002356E099|nr:hypothetical protein [Colibacter massiliensis]